MNRMLEILIQMSSSFLSGKNSQAIITVILIEPATQSGICIVFLPSAMEPSAIAPPSSIKNAPTLRFLFIFFSAARITRCPSKYHKSYLSILPLVYHSGFSYFLPTIRPVDWKLNNAIGSLVYQSISSLIISKTPIDYPSLHHGSRNKYYYALEPKR